MLTGTVVGAPTSRPLTGATVQVPGVDLEVESDSAGGLRAALEVGSTDAVAVVVFETGYRAGTVSTTVLGVPVSVIVGDRYANPFPADGSATVTARRRS